MNWKKKITASNVKGYDALVEVMTHMLRFHSSTEKYDRMFEPLRELVAMLKRHDVQVPAALLGQLDNCAVVWRDFKKRCAQVNDALLPIQREEIERIRSAEKQFCANVDTFVKQRYVERVPLTRCGPSAFAPRVAYNRLFEIQLQLSSLVKQHRSLRNKQKLFGLPLCINATLATCLGDTTLVKMLWDVASLLDSMCDSWKGVPFDRLDIDSLEDEIKRIFGFVRSIDRRARGWTLYEELENDVKRWLAVLPLVQSLRHPSIKAKHWKELMSLGTARTDQKDLIADDASKSSISEIITLDQLFSLELHAHTEMVTAIVEKAQREAHIEAQLKQLRDVWKDRHFTFTVTSDIGISLVVIPEELTVSIEEHQLILQQLAATRHASEFVEELQAQQTALSTVELVIGLLSEAQTAWNYLISIFLDSDDIQKMLTQETTKFKEVDTVMRGILRTIRAHSGSIMELCQRSPLEGPLTEVLKGARMVREGARGLPREEAKGLPALLLPFYAGHVGHSQRGKPRPGESPQQTRRQAVPWHAHSVICRPERQAAQPSHHWV